MRDDPGRAVEREAEPILDALLSDGHLTFVPVRGRSMRPALVDGDTVVIGMFLGLPRPGQIVLARVEGILVVHRLVAVEMRDGRRRYRLQGDAEPEKNAAVTRENLLGRAVAIVRDGIRLPIEDDPRAVRRRASEAVGAHVAFARKAA